MLRLWLLMPLFLASSGFYASLPGLNSWKPKILNPRLVHGTTMMSFSAETPISSWDKDRLKAELIKINLEGSATILHSANVNGLTLLRASEKYGLASVYKLNISEAVQIEAYAEKKRKEDERIEEKKREEEKACAEKKRKDDERIEVELRKRIEKDQEKQSESHSLLSFKDITRIFISFVRRCKDHFGAVDKACQPFRRKLQ
jgi:hypothetical protein